MNTNDNGLNKSLAAWVDSRQMHGFYAFTRDEDYKFNEGPSGSDISV